jgi:hypothetical protein
LVLAGKGLNAFSVLFSSFIYYCIFPSLQDFSKRQDTVKSTQDALLDEVKAEGAKFGDDVKYLAELTSGYKKLNPWITKSEAKRAVGMIKPGNFGEAQDQFEDAKVSCIDIVANIWGHIMLRDLLTQKFVNKFFLTDFGYPRACGFRKTKQTNRFRSPLY